MENLPRPIDLDRQVETTQNMQPTIFNQKRFGDAKGIKLGIYFGHWNATWHKVCHLSIATHKIKTNLGNCQYRSLTIKRWCKKMLMHVH